MRATTAAPVSSPPERAMTPAELRFRLADRDEAMLKVDLSDLELPQVNDLNVDGLKRSWLSRIFGKH